MRVLLIEDNPADADLLIEMASDAGIGDLQIHRVPTLTEASAFLSSREGSDVDIVVTDLGLPDAVDIEAVPAVRKMRPDVPVVVLTGSSGRGDRAVDVLRAGADDYLVKGRYDADALSRSLRYAIERRQAMNAAADAIREEARVVETLQRIGGLLVSELEIDAIVQTVTDEATALAGADFGAFFYNVLDEQGGSYMLYALSGASREAFEQFPMPRATRVFRPTFEGTAIVRSDDITSDPRYGHNRPYSGMPEGHLPVRSYLAVPVVSRYGGVLGGLFFGHPNPGMFTERHERIVSGIAGWAATAMDNARLYEAEHRARMAAEEANRAKSDFLTTMSHELRTPLNAMIGYTDLWRMGIPEQLPARVLEQVERVRFSARHLLELIEEILTYSRIEAAQETVELETIALADLVQSVAAVVEPLALAKGLRFALEGPASETILHTDPRKVRQIAINLLSNAVKFTDDGEVALEVREVGDDVVFEVRDTGIGIAADDLERIFEPFWQVRQSTPDRPAGTGLGLAVSRRLARLLGGDILPKSVEGQGTTFIVTLPARTPEPAA